MSVTASSSPKQAVGVLGLGIIGSRIAENLRKAIMALALKTTSASRTLLTISLGVSCFFPKRGQTENLLIDAADKALYKAKYAGRNRVEVMTLADSERSVTRPLLDQA